MKLYQTDISTTYDMTKVEIINVPIIMEIVTQAMEFDIAYKYTAIARRQPLQLWHCRSYIFRPSLLCRGK